MDNILINGIIQQDGILVEIVGRYNPEVDIDIVRTEYDQRKKKSKGYWPSASFEGINMAWI